MNLHDLTREEWEKLRTHIQDVLNTWYHLEGDYSFSEIQHSYLCGKDLHLKGDLHHCIRLSFTIPFRLLPIKINSITDELTLRIYKFRLEIGK